MNTDQLEQIKQYLRAGLPLALKFHTGPLNGQREVAPLRILKLAYENKAYWVKTISGDFLLSNTPVASLVIEIQGRYAPLFDSSGITLIRPSSTDRFTLPYYHYMVIRYDLIRPGSMVIINNEEYKSWGIVINKGAYMDLLPLFQDLPKRRFKDLTGINVKNQDIAIEDLIFEVIAITINLQKLNKSEPEVAGLTFLVPFTKLTELGFIITELI